MKVYIAKYYHRKRYGHESSLMLVTAENEAIAKSLIFDNDPEKEMSDWILEEVNIDKHHVYTMHTEST
jgi:hypothetical protein